MQGKAQPLLLSPEPLTPSARHGQGPGSWELGRPGHQGHLPRPEKSTAPTLRNLDLPDPACPPYHQRDKTRAGIWTQEREPQRPYHCLGCRSQAIGELSQRTVPGDCIEV